MDNRVLLSFYEILLASVMALHTDRGRFYPNKDYGSGLRSSGLSAEELLGCARQALYDFDGVYVKSARLDGGKAVFVLLINNREKEVEISL